MNSHIAKGSNFVEIAKQPDSPRKIRAGSASEERRMFARSAQRSMLAAEPEVIAAPAAPNAEFMVNLLKAVFSDPRVAVTAKSAGMVFAALVAVSCGSVVSDDEEDRHDSGQDSADVQPDQEEDALDADVAPDVPEVFPDAADVRPDEGEADAPPVDVPDVITDGEADSLPEADAEAHEDAPAEAEAETPEDVPEEAEGTDAPEAEADSTETVDTYDCTAMSRAETVVVVETETICGMAPTTTGSYTVAWNEGADCVDTTETRTLDSWGVSLPSAVTDVACTRGDLLHAPNGFEVIVEGSTAMLNSAKEVAGTPAATPLVYGSSLGGAPNWSITAWVFNSDRFSGSTYDATGAGRGTVEVYGTAASSRAALGLPYTEFPMAPPATQGVMAYDYVSTGGGRGNTGASIIGLPMIERVAGSVEGLLGTDGTTVVGTCEFGTVLSGGNLAGYLWLCTPAKK